MLRRLMTIMTATSVTVGVVAAVLALAPAATAAGVKPHIVAHPDSVMVNTATMLKGTHFPAKTSITLEECSQRNWIAPNSPCDTTNAVTLTTHAKGQFKTSFTVDTCPASGNATPGFSQKCYIGVPMGTGVDTLTLEGAVAITVTGP
jgi:hypothetical protein